MVWGEVQANNDTNDWTNTASNETQGTDFVGKQDGSEALVITVIALGCVVGMVVLAAVIRSICLKEED